MAHKRKKSHGDGKVESQDDPAANLGDQSRAGHLEIFSDDRPADADQSDAGQEVRDLDRAGIYSRESRDQSAYLVACHWDCSSSYRRYSVFKMVDLAASSASEASRKRLKRLGSLKADAGGKVFTSVSSRNRAWIVGVGGDHRDTIIFDTSKEKKVHVNLKTYQIVNPLVLENRDETMLTVNPEVAVSSQQECTLKIASSTHGFSPSGFSLVSMYSPSGFSLVSMDASN